MGCVAAGDLRAFLDGELQGAETTRVEQHLITCVSCRAELEKLRDSASVVGTALDRLAPADVEVPRPHWSLVRDRARVAAARPVTTDRGAYEMFEKLVRLVGGGRTRRIAATVAALAVVALLFTFSPVQGVAGSFLSLFRVQKFVAVNLDPTSLPKLASPSELGSITTTGDQTSRSVTLAEAEKLVGFQVMTPASLPAGLQAKPRAVRAVNAFSMTYTPDLKKVRAYLASIGASNVTLPDKLDGAPITMQMQPSVTLLYLEAGPTTTGSEGTIQPVAGQRYLYLAATTSPTMSVPEGIDVGQIRTEMLKVPGLPPDLVSQLKAIDDWQNTVVVPVVKGTSREVSVQGEKGLLVTQSDGQGTMLVWLKGGVVYNLSGNVSETEILAAANSMK